MKFTKITGGLGNQMFVYAFCLELRKRGENSSLFFTTWKSKYEHNGYELDLIFNITANQTTFNSIITFFLSLYFQIIKIGGKIFGKSSKDKMLGFIGVKVRTAEQNFIYYSEIFKHTSKHELYAGTWQSEKYFSTVKNEVRNSFKFDETKISNKTREILKNINTTTSVSIHIRRGDYLSSKFVDGFSNICTIDYYNRSIDKIKSNLDLPVFFVFSDDQEWVKQNIIIKNAFYLNHNIGKNSWQDMYLMSKCKHNIIANSSFSWWGAWLNSNNQKIVIAPKKWWNDFKQDDVVPETWVRL